jgi:hypothetical protein
MRFLRRPQSNLSVGILLTVLLLTGLTAPIAGCQLLFLVSGEYARRVVWEGTSPDGRYHLEVRVRANFPAFDFLGPESTA